MPIHCALCGERFEDIEELNKHLRKKHRNKIKRVILEHPVKPKGNEK